MENSTKLHLLTAKRIFCYLQETRNFRDIYKRDEKYDMIGFTDSDFACDLDDRKTHLILSLCLEETISWSSKK